MIKSEWKVTLFTFYFAFPSNMHGMCYLLINPENHKLQKAHNSDKNICLEVLFSLSFRRETLEELRGESQAEGWK